MELIISMCAERFAAFFCETARQQSRIMRIASIEDGPHVRDE